MARCGKLTKRSKKCKNLVRGRKRCYHHSSRRARKGRLKKKKTYSEGYVTKLKNQLSSCQVGTSTVNTVVASTSPSSKSQNCDALRAELEERKGFIAKESKRAQKRILELTKALKETKRAHDFLVTQVTNLGKDIDTVVHQRNSFEAKMIDAQIASAKEKKQLQTQINTLDKLLASHKKEIVGLKKANEALTTAKVALAEELRQFKSSSFFKRMVEKVKDMAKKNQINGWKKKAAKVDRILAKAEEPVAIAARRCRRKRRKARKKR
jgi:chromosome segregation ATPase